MPSGEYLDVIGGGTFRLVVGYLKQFSPGALSLYLGHTQNVPTDIGTTSVAENHLDGTLDCKRASAL